MTDVTDAGILTTATGLLFSGGRDGNFYPLDAKNGGAASEDAARRADRRWTDVVFDQWAAV